MPKAHPAFVAHFTDPVYSDEGGEFAPFGTDEGWDLLYTWAERRDELGPRTTVMELIEGSGLGDLVAELDRPEPPGVPRPGGQVDAATITVGAGFTQPLSGRLNTRPMNPSMNDCASARARLAFAALTTRRSGSVSWINSCSPKRSTKS